MIGDDFPKHMLLINAERETTERTLRQLCDEVSLAAHIAGLREAAEIVFQKSPSKAALDAIHARISSLSQEKENG